MRYNSPSKQKFTLLGWTMGWIEWLVLMAAMTYGVWHYFDGKEVVFPAEVTINDVESVSLGNVDDGPKAVDLWLMKFQLDFDRTEKEMSDARELRYFKQAYLKKCLIETAAANGQLLSAAYVAACLKKADLEALEAVEYWKKK
ncbi:hypothetical protein D9M71_467220 [compost metagenome]